MILTLHGNDERRQIINKMHRIKNRNPCRRLYAILLLADRYNISAVSRLTTADRFASKARDASPKSPVLHLLTLSGT